MRLEGKVVVITGASEGIGAACAAAFRSRGARLSLNARSEEKLKRVAGAEALATTGDITLSETRERLVSRTLERFGAIDVLVNNAGAGLYIPAWQAPMPEARRLWELNFFAALELIQLVVPHMQARRSGTIVNISSIAGQFTLPWFTLYSASKFALNSLTEGLRMELRRHGVHVMSVCPGYVKTGFQHHLLGGRVPQRVAGNRRFAITAEECAAAVVRGVERRARTVVTPGAGRILVWIQRLVPGLVENVLAGIVEKREPEA